MYHKNKKNQNKIVLKKSGRFFLFQKGAKSNANIFTTNNICFNLRFGVSVEINKRFRKKDFRRF